MRSDRAAASYALVLVTLLNYVNYVDRFILSAVLPRIKIDLNLSDLQLGLLANAFLVAYFLTSPLFGPLGDRGSGPRLLAAAAACWSLATGLAGLARNFVQLALARAAVGVGEAAYTTISPALLADHFAPARRGRVFAVFYAAMSALSPDMRLTRLRSADSASGCRHISNACAGSSSRGRICWWVA